MMIVDHPDFQCSRCAAKRSVSCGLECLYLRYAWPPRSRGFGQHTHCRRRVDALKACTRGVKHRGIKTTECSRVLLLRSCAPACCIHSGQVLVSVRGPYLAVRFSPGLSARGEPSWINAPAASRDIDGKVREWLRKTASAVQVYLALVLQRFRGFSAYLCTLCLTCASPSQSGTASPGMSRRAREIAARHKSKKRDKEQQRQDVRAQQLVDLHTRFLQASSFAPHVVLVLDLIFFRFTFVPP